MSRGGFEALDPCVHCGFCLPACPTYLATGDESDSPRGRILLMRALEHGELAPSDPAVRRHLDACLGCRGCEPVCPAGVGYGRGLEAAREVLVRSNGLPLPARAVLAVFRRELWWRPIFTVARWLRSSGIPKAAGGKGPIGFALAMLDASRPGGLMRTRRLQPTVASKSTSILNGELGYKFSERVRLRADGFNLFDAKVSDIDYFFESRLKDEPEPVADIHFHAAIPRSVRVALQVSF